TPTSHNQLSDLDSDRPSVVGANMVRRYFAVGELSPTVVLVENPRIDFNSEAGRDALARASDRLAQLDNVAEVRSLPRPLGEAARQRPSVSFLRPFTDRALKAAADARYVSNSARQASDRNHIARLDVVFKTDPFSTASLQTLDRVVESLDEQKGPGQPL